MEFERLQIEQLVELKDEYANVYPLSVTGARGHISAKREMPKSDPEVYISWDKLHWRYHGEKDGWTFEHHFRPVDDAIPETGPDMNEILTQAHLKLDQERCADCGEIHDQHEDFLDTLATAQEAALDSDGYFVIVLKPHDEEGITLYEPQIFSEVLHPAAMRMIEAQLVDLATQIFEGWVLNRVNDLINPDDGQ